MEDIQTLLEKYNLLTDTYNASPFDYSEDVLRKIKDQQVWDKIFSLNTDNGACREFFNTQEPEVREDYFKFAISCFACFVQVNFTGPEQDEETTKFLESREEFQNVEYANRLSMNNEEINPNTKYPVLLVVSETIFDTCLIANMVNLWWCCRALSIHQEILDELSPTLLSNADRLYKLLQGVDLNPRIQAHLDLELGQLYQKFRHISKSKEHLNSACDTLGLEYNLVGRLGRRTKFQTEDLAQLALEINLVDKKDVERPPVELFDIPKNLALQDEVRLDTIKFTEKTSTVHLPNTEQKLILALVQQNLIACPPDELQVEELLPFLDVVINQNNTFCVRIVALLLRCKFESNNKRTIERCLKTGEDLIKYVATSEVPFWNRFGDVFGTSFPPIWKIEALYADNLLNLGLIKNSLDIYLKVKLWDEVIVCYTILKMRHKAAEIILEQLEKKPTVKMMCLLGDATDDPTCYEKAWEMSKRRSHRAQRHWGQWLFCHKKYEECIPHFEKSLSINPLQASTWLSLGFAALKTENWQTAATAYRRYTNLEPDGFEAWNNLAQAYIKIGNKRSAHQAILEALKCNFDNWKVWENLLVVSCDISHFSDVIRAYHRLIDLKEKYLNIEILNLLVYSVCIEVPDSEGDSTNRFLQKTRELMGRIVGLYPNNGLVWELYACLAPVMMLRVQRLQRAFRGYTQGCWDKDPKICFQVLNVCRKLADIVLDDEMDPTNTILSSVKLNLSSAVTAVMRHNWEETKTWVEEVAGQLDLLVEKIKKGNAVRVL